MATSSGAKPSTGKRSIFESSEFCAYTPLSSGATGGIQALGLIGTGQARKYAVSRTTTRIAARLIVCFMAGVAPQNSLSCRERRAGLRRTTPKLLNHYFSRDLRVPVVRFAPSPLPLSQRERESIFRRELLRLGFRVQPPISSFPVRPSARASEAPRRARAVGALANSRCRQRFRVGLRSKPGGEVLRVPLRRAEHLT